MLQGARIPFKLDLSPWVLEPVHSESLSDLSLSPSRRDSCSRRWSTLSVASSTLSTATPRRPSTVFTLLDVLRLHTGGNPGARRVWEYLRGRSNELLTKKQEELDANGRDTFSAFTREQVLGGNLKVNILAYRYLYIIKSCWYHFRCHLRISTETISIGMYG